MSDGLTSSRRRPPWSESETLALVQAWGVEVARSRTRSKLKSELERSAAVHHAFLELTGKSAAERSLLAVDTKRKRLRCLFQRVREFNDAQKARGEPTWFELPSSSRRLLGIQRNADNNITRSVFDSMSRVFAELPMRFRTSRLESTKMSDRDAESATTARGNWSYCELMALARSFAEVCRAYPTTAGHISEDRKQDLYSKYLCYGGLQTRSARAIAQQARYMLDSYRFIVAFNVHARVNRELAWHHRSEQARAALVAKHSGNGRVLRLMNATMFAVLDKTLSIRVVASASKRKRSSSTRPQQRPRGEMGAKRLKAQASEVHQVTEHRHYSMSSRRAVVSVDEKRNVRSGHFEASDSDTSTSSSSDCSEEEEFQESRHQVVCLLRRHLRKHRGNDVVDKGEGNTTTIRSAKRQRRTLVSSPSGGNDYQSLLEHTVTAMSTQLSQLDRRLTEARINENQRMLVSVLRACRQSSGFGSAPTALAREMLTRAGANLLEIADLVEEQEEEDGELRRRLLSSLADGDGTNRRRC